MSNGPEFFQTILGRKFYDTDVPRVVQALQRIADALEAANKQHKQEVEEQLAMTAAFLTRELCAEEAQKLWGEEAAAEIRKVLLPHEQVSR